MKEKFYIELNMIDWLAHRKIEINTHVMSEQYKLSP